MAQRHALWLNANRLVGHKEARAKTQAHGLLVNCERWVVGHGGSVGDEKLQRGCGCIACSVLGLSLSAVISDAEEIRPFVRC
jgi:hypothetical protein